MAISAAAIKAASTLLKSKKGRKIIKVVLGCVAGVFILIAGVFIAISNALSLAGKALTEWVLGSASSVPTEYVQAVTDMRVSYEKLDAAVEAVNEQLTGSKVDVLWVKSVFYVLYFDQPQPPDAFYSAFTACFVTTVDGKPALQTDAVKLVQALKDAGVDKVDGSTLQRALEVYKQMPVASG